MTEEEHRNVAVVHHLNTLVNESRFDEMDELFADGYRDHNPGWQIESVADLKRIIADAHFRFQLHNVIQDTVASQDKVVVRVANEGRHVSDAFGIAPTGKATSMQTIEIYRFDSGKVAERWVVSDRMSLMLQLGVKLPSANGRHEGGERD